MPLDINVQSWPIYKFLKIRNFCNAEIFDWVATDCNILSTQLQTSKNANIRAYLVLLIICVHNIYDLAITSKYVIMATTKDKLRDSKVQRQEQNFLISDPRAP